MLEGLTPLSRAFELGQIVHDRFEIFLDVVKHVVFDTPDARPPRFVLISLTAPPHTQWERPQPGADTRQGDFPLAGLPCP